MPMNTYCPDWDAVRAWLAKMSPLVAADYSGLAAVRLHRTGMPLTLEILGEELPEGPLPPLILLNFRDGKLEDDLDGVEVDYDVPWARESDFHAYRDQVMEYYQTEDALEPVAEQIQTEESPEEELLAKALNDRREILA